MSVRSRFRFGCWIPAPFCYKALGVTLYLVSIATFMLPSTYACNNAYATSLYFKFSLLHLFLKASCKDSSIWIDIDFLAISFILLTLIMLSLCLCSVNHNFYDFIMFFVKNNRQYFLLAVCVCLYTIYCGLHII